MCVNLKILPTPPNAATLRTKQDSRMSEKYRLGVPVNTAGRCSFAAVCWMYPCQHFSSVALRGRGGVISTSRSDGRNELADLQIRFLLEQGAPERC